MCLFYDHDCTGHEIAPNTGTNATKFFTLATKFQKISRQIGENRIVVDVNEKVTALDEVVVTPENREKFLDLKEEEFKRFDYSSDKSTRVVNVINEQGKLRNGLNFVNLYKLIANTINNKSNEESSTFNYNPSDLIREVYDDIFFTKSLGIQKDKINEFLIYCDENFPSKILLKKDKEFELIDFLVKQSKKFNRIVSKG